MLWKSELAASTAFCASSASLTRGFAVSRAIAARASASAAFGSSYTQLVQRCFPTAGTGARTATLLQLSLGMQPMQVCMGDNGNSLHAMSVAYTGDVCLPAAPAAESACPEPRIAAAESHAAVLTKQRICHCLEWPNPLMYQQVYSRPAAHRSCPAGQARLCSNTKHKNP